MENSHPIQQFPRQIQPILKPIDTKENLIEVVSNSIANSLLDSQKQNIKEVKPKPVEKTQRIKKDKKIDKKTTVREETPSRNEVQLFQGQLIQEALQSLWGFITVKARKGVKRSRDLDKESMLEFLQLIEWQYSEAVNKYRKANINKETCGNLKSILSKFVNDILSNFPILQLVYRMALEQYATGPLMSRFNRLMERNITPIIRIKSQNYLAEQAGEWYCSRHPNSVLKKSQRGQSVESQFEKEKKREQERQRQEEEERLKQEQDEQKKQEKKKRKNRRKKQKRESEQKQQEDDEEFQQINKFLQGLTIDQDNRVDCRVQEIRLQKWKQRSRQSMKNNHN